MTASLGYVGNKIDHLSDIYLYNQKQLNSAGQAVPGPYMQTAYRERHRPGSLQRLRRHLDLQCTGSNRGAEELPWPRSPVLLHLVSKCLTNTLGYFGSYGDEEGAGESQTQATQNFFQNEYDPKADYGRCTTDAASNFGGYALYNLPFGRGKALGSTSTR